MSLRWVRVLVPMLASLPIACGMVTGLSGYELAPTTDGGGADSALDTSVVDSLAPDTNRDTSVVDSATPDTSIADTFVADTFVADTFVVDTFVVDTFVVDTFVADTPDTFVADTFVADTFVVDTFVVDTFVEDTFVADTADPDACVGMVCTMPPMPTCASGVARRTFSPTGTCSAGKCSYASTDTACPPPEVCLGGTCMLPPSCAGGLVCGGESCCVSPLVMGGTYKRAYDGGAFTEGGYQATVSNFRLDKFEITVGRFRKFVAASVAGWKPAPGSGKHTHLNGGSGLAVPGGFEAGWDPTWASSLGTSTATWESSAHLGCHPSTTWTSAPGANESKPINCISWTEAAAFCIWDGGFLPSEAEWNYAASGGSEQRVYPWGATVPGTNANLAVYGCYYAGTGACTGIVNVAPVGSVPAGNGKWGQSDLAGNMWEWMFDWHKDPFNELVCKDCAYATPSVGRAFRGASWFSNADFLRSAARNSAPENSHTPNVGGRCARNP